MAIVISDLILPLDADESSLRELAARAVHKPPEAIKNLRLTRMSLDARKKNAVVHNCTVLAELDDAEEKNVLKRGYGFVSPAPQREDTEPRFGQTPLNKPVIVVGMGPAGIFAAYRLAKYGYKPIVLERGKRVEERQADVKRFMECAALDTESNVMFGEGGAGAFSDGKLTTRIKDARTAEVLELLAENGAPDDILYMAKPHVGTDKLLVTLKNMREKLKGFGAELRFSTRLADFETDPDGALTSVTAECAGRRERIECDACILAIGQGARDTYRLLEQKGVELQPKAFAVGVRVEHPRALIDRAQFGAFANHPRLGAAEYALADRCGERGVYTFCMCPGGVVIASPSEEGQVVVNGMSFRARDSENSNAAIVVQVTPQDFGLAPLDGVRFQEAIERAAYRLGGGGFVAPASRVENFLNKTEPKGFGGVKPSYMPGVAPRSLYACLPDYVTAGIGAGIRAFSRKLKGFDMSDAVLTAVESRTSSPVRIARGEHMEATRIRSLYPVGEGAGYAGGIVSAAVDGMKAADAVMEKFCRGVL
ncbi:MAG: FAD-dependent protein [Clostridiaceae bacterium]